MTLAIVIASCAGLAARQGMWGVATQFAGDLFHPNDRGYRVWGSAFFDAVDERLRLLAR